MNFVGRVARGFKEFYNEINPATLTGAIDVVVVKQEDGSYRCSPFHVRFGKLGVIRSKEKIVDIEINGQKVDDLHMILGEAGEAFFLEKTQSEDDKSSSCDSIINEANITDKPQKNSITNEMLIIETKQNNEISNNNLNEIPTPKLTTQPIPINKSLSTPIVHKFMSSDDQKESISISKELKPINFFSDGELTPELASPVVSRPPTPKSDTELEMSKRHINNPTDNQWSWDWGQLPERQNNLTLAIDKTQNSLNNPVIKNSKSESTNDSLAKPKESSSSKLLGGVFNLISNKSNATGGGSTKIPPEMGGIYLDDTEKLDSEVAALYLDQKSNSQKFFKNNQLKEPQQSQINIQSNKDDDQESGNGQSLPQSPFKDFYSILGDVQISLCGFTLNNSSVTLTSNNANSSKLTSSSAQVVDSNPESLSQSNSPKSSSSPLAILAKQNSTSNQNISFSASSTSSSSLLDLATSLPNANLVQSVLNSNETSIINQSQLNYEDLFQQYAVTFDRFIEEISHITTNPNLVIKINNRYLNWSSAAPIILSAIVFHKPLPSDTINMILESNMPKMKPSLQQQQSPPSLLNSQQQNASDKKSGGGWGRLFWGKKSSSSAQSNATNPENTTLNSLKQTTTLTMITTNTTTTSNTTIQTNSTSSLLTTANVSKIVNSSIGNMNKNDCDYEIMLDEDLMNANNIEQVKLISEEIDSTLLVESLNQTNNKQKNLDEKESPVESSNYYQRQFVHNHSNHHHHHHHHYHRRSTNISFLDGNELIFKKDKYRKITRLSSDFIQKLHLLPGSNEIQYSVTTALQGTTRITSYIFLWNYDDKIIVSDIDGTITKSDVWGQVLPIFGRDWSQAGVADLFTAIERNRYKFMYLSARAIGQSKITRDLLRNINQDGFTLPEGPLLVTPTSLFTAFQKEVIEKKPEEFKISCLKDIQSLFPSDNNPYYAGYGNKSTDVIAYKAVGIPESRIFTINPQGEVKHEISRAFQSSYSKLCDYVDLIFPPFKPSSLQIKSEYASFSYWRDLPPISIMEEIEKEIKESSKDAKENKDNLNSKKIKIQFTSSSTLSTSSKTKTNASSQNIEIVTKTHETQLQ